MAHLSFLYNKRMNEGIITAFYLKNGNLNIRTEKNL